MKKALNYIESIRFKIINDEMTRLEALIFFAILIGASAMAIHFLDPILTTQR